MRGNMNNINITLSHEQLDILSKVIVELPYKVAAPLIEHINKEIQKTLIRELMNKRHNREF